MPIRTKNKLREITITPHYISHPEGSVLITYGHTKVLCCASIEERVPQWLANSGKGFITAEYDMLPRATITRRKRDSKQGRIQGRTQEISRLIGRSLRVAIDMKELGERLITIDCDVIQADGGTRTASITGGYVALAIALKEIFHMEVDLTYIMAVSVGILDNKPTLDLDYNMDSRAEVDMNIVMTHRKKLVEIQGTGEKNCFTQEQLNEMVNLAFSCTETLVKLQEQAIKTPRSNKLITYSSNDI